MFEGHAEPRMVRPGELSEVETLPEGYERIGRLRARCTLVEGARPDDGARLIDVDCTESRLMAALRERAAEVGAEVLVTMPAEKTSLLLGPSAWASGGTSS